MAGRHFGAVLCRIERLFAAGTVSGLSEGQLIERFATRGDEAAFEALLARHGPMVLGICRQVLHNPDDVEDAFQATFLVLVRKAGTLRDRDLVGNWLFGVASRVALRARAVAARRRAVEGAGTPVDAAAPGDNHDRESRTMIHEEVRRLPEKYRNPVLLCYLEGLSHEEAAQHLGWPVGTVKGRLTRARELLRGRLTRRGVTLSAGALAAELTRDVRAAVPAALLESTIRAALPVAAGRVLATGAVAANVAALTEGVLNAMFWTKLKSAGAGLLAVGIVTLGVGGWAYQAAGKNEGPPGAPPGATAAAATVEVDVETKAVVPKTGPGSGPSKAVEFAALVQQSQETFSSLLEGTLANDGRFEDLERLIRWSSHVLESQLDLVGDKAHRRAALVAHRDRMRQLHELTQSLPPSDPDQPVKADLARVHRQMAERKLAEATAAESKPSRPKEATGDPVPPTPAEPTPKSLETAPGKLKSHALAKRLDEPISLSFARQTPLEDVLEYLKTAEHFPNGSGIPIYVDPAVREKLKQLVQIDLEGVPLRTILALLLSQVGLEAGIQDDLLIISTEDGLVDYRDIASHFSQVPEYPGPGFGPAGDRMSPVGKSEVTLAKLARTITLTFLEETPLDTVLRAIRQAAKRPNEAGIPLYVGPPVEIWNEIGDKSERKTIGTLPVKIDLKDVPLRTCLALLLSQQRRKYGNDSKWYNVIDGRIIDGLLIIGPREWLQSLPTNQAGFGGGMGPGMPGMMPGMTGHFR